ncbi:UPF0149 family protein [Ramlibacter sp. AW1]|uniref:UPF0149 family protein n=1 Tax=Ramlibacter aurantiacus TaxID=2801330 RepID=A0A937D5K7_9BURK|nr:UPF0149 family protein [Ramlibacter aurantiacus]MBL0421417.1 UPF0149 family protein [Ramlibacter aurantiacus]
MKDLQAPLTPEDFDALDEALDAMREHDESIPNWEFCDGFLAALVCTRREIESEEYWPVLMGESFRPMEHMEFVLGFKRRLAEVRVLFQEAMDQKPDEVPRYFPEMLDLRGAHLALPQDEREGVDLDQLPPFGAAWAHGFLWAVEAFEEDWAPPRDKELAVVLDDALDAIAALTTPDTGTPSLSMFEENGPPTISEERLHAYGHSVWSVLDLYRLWQSLGPNTQPLRKAPEPGRNDPCPCGSGKKYKKCHGA